MDANCFRHPKSAAVGKCRYCDKPVCPECIHRAAGEVFCGAECAGSFSLRGDRLHRELKRKSGGPSVLGTLARLILILGAMWLALEWMGIADLLPGIG